MRIALVCPYDLEAPGGVQVHVRDLASQLAARGHVVEVFGPGSGGLGRPVRFPYRGTVAPIAPWPGGVRLARRAFERFSPDIVHVHEPFTPSASMWAALAATVPVVATFHAWLDRARVYEVAEPALRPVARRLTASIAVSQAAAAFVERAVPGLEPVVIANGVSVSRFAEAPRLDWPPGRRIAWAHRLDPQKGFPVLVEAFRRLASERTDLLLSVGGDGADRVAVDGLPASVRERISMFGRVGHDEVPSLLAGADVAVAAATGQESFGIAVVEAMAAGVPVVATDIEGYREVVTDGVDGLLVAPGDPAALASAIARVLDDDDLARRLGSAGHDTAAAFDWNLVTDRIEDRYRWALGRSSLR
jgi:phosphatidylinositol alpha-mannosyltransferase